MVHRVLKSVSSAVRMIIGRVIVQRRMMVSNLKKRNLGAYAYGAWTCSNPDNSRDEKCSSDSFHVDTLCGTAISPVQDDDEYEAHVAFLVESEGFGVLEVQPPLLVALRSLRLCSPRVMNMIHDFQMLIRLVVDHRSILEMVPRQRLHPCPDFQSEMMLLVTSGSLCICSWISRNRLP